MVWLGREAFYSYDGAAVTPISSQIDALFRRVTFPRMAQACSLYDKRSKEYRCWVSIDGTVENKLCLIFDGQGWRQRTDTTARDACVTRDHRSYPLIAGHPNDPLYNGVYLLDHVGNQHDVDFKEANSSRVATIETTWLEAMTSNKSKSTHTIYLWLRETEKSDLTIEVMRDGRSKVIETTTAKRYSEKDVPDFWGDSKLDGAATWVERKLFWTRAHVYVPSAETFKFRISGAGYWEFIGITIDEAPRFFGSAQVPP